MKIEDYALTFLDGTSLPLTAQHRVTFQFGIYKKPNYETRCYERERTGYNRLVLSRPDGTQQMFGFTACAADDGVIRPSYSDEALERYTEE